MKNSFAEHSQKKLCNRKPNKRRCPFWRTFSICQISAVLTKQEFFNRHSRFHSKWALCHSKRCNLITTLIWYFSSRPRRVPLWRENSIDRCLSSLSYSRMLRVFTFNLVLAWSGRTNYAATINESFSNCLLPATSPKQSAIGKVK